MRKKQSKQATQTSTTLQFGIIHPLAAGIDVGSMNMMVSYPGENGIQTVKEYEAYTSDLQSMAEQLQQAGVTHVCMEATGVYWIAVFNILEQYGFTVTLVNARILRMWMGRKQMLRIASGCSNCMPMVYCVLPT